MPAILNGSELTLSGAVGVDADWGLDDGFTCADVTTALAKVGDKRDITVRLNSGGGVATDGTAIHAALARHKGKKTFIVEGIAASAASIIAMAADDLVMSLGAIMMIHDPSGFTVGTEADHAAQINSLATLASSMASIYSAKSGRNVADCREIMKAETWFTADEAVAARFADRVEGRPKNGSPSAFAYNRYKRAPSALRAMANANGWSLNPRKISEATTEPALAADEVRRLVARARTNHPHVSASEADLLIRMSATSAQVFDRLVAAMGDSDAIEAERAASRAASRASMISVLKHQGLAPA